MAVVWSIELPACTQLRIKLSSLFRYKWVLLHFIHNGCTICLAFEVVEIMNDDERKKKRKLGTLIRVVRRFISRSRKGTCRPFFFFAYHPNCLAQEFRENVLHFVICNYFMPEQSIDQNIFPEVQEQLSGFYPPAPKVNDRGH